MEILIAIDIGNPKKIAIVFFLFASSTNNIVPNKIGFITTHTDIKKTYGPAPATGRYLCFSLGMC